MKFNPAYFALHPNAYDDNQKKITELRQYCDSLVLTSAKKEVLQQLFKYAEDALCKAPQDQSQGINNLVFAAIAEAFKKVVAALFKKAPKSTDPSRFNSYNEIIKAIPNSDLHFLDTVLQQIGEAQAFVSRKFTPNSSVSMMLSRGSRFASMVAPAANSHREVMLTDAALWLKHSGQGYLVAQMLIIMQALQESTMLQIALGHHIAHQHQNETLLESFFGDLVHTSIRNTLMMVQLSLMMLSIASLMFSKELVGANPYLRSAAAFFTHSLSTEGAIVNMPEVNIAVPEMK